MYASGKNTGIVWGYLTPTVENKEEKDWKITRELVLERFASIVDVCGPGYCLGSI